MFERWLTYRVLLARNTHSNFVREMAPTLLKEFLLQCNIDAFLKNFWLDIGWYERFLSDKLEDINISIGEWSVPSSGSLTSFTRNVKSYHPSKISFPGLPSHAEVRLTDGMHWMRSFKILDCKHIVSHSYWFSFFITVLFYLNVITVS